MPGLRHQTCFRRFRREGRARRYFWSQSWTVQPPLDNFAKRREVFCSTRFQHIDIHKAWLYPDRSTRNHIDHVVNDGSHVSNVPDVRTFRGPNMDPDFLVAAKVRLRISASRTAPSNSQRKLDIKKLLCYTTIDKTKLPTIWGCNYIRRENQFFIMPI